ncbi:MAG: cation:proton antiporter, partial [Gemmataceae bacterium]
NDLHTPSGHVAVGWLVVEDLFTVVVLVVLPAAMGGGAVAAALGMATVKIVALVALTFVLGGRLIPWVFARVAATRSRELFTVCVLVVALGIAVGSAKVFGVSMALGAFLAGMVVGRSDFSLRAATDALPMRDAFAVLFFVSAGMLFDPKFLLQSPGLVGLTLGVVLVGKPLAAVLIVLLLRYPLKVALSVAVALAQIGEFSFILADLGKQLGVMPGEANNALVAAAIVSIAINPLLYRLVGPAARWLGRNAPAPEAPDRPADGPRAVVVGYGPVGRTLARILRDMGIEPTVVEMNLQTVQRLRAEGTAAVYGDAGHPATLEAAGLAGATGLFLSSSGLHDAAEIIRHAKELNPAVRVLVRCAYLREAEAVRRAGADAAFAGEGEVALAMAETVLRHLGATGEQLDRERDRVREELFGAEGGEGAGR